MAKNKTQLTILEQMLAYQTRLQGVANDLAIKLADAALSTNADVAKFIATELPKKSKSIKAELERIERLIAKIETLRAPSYKLAQDLIFSTSADVVQAATDETAKEFNRALADAARKEREKRFCKTLTPSQQQAILDGQAISGSTIAYWYRNWQRKDLERIASACQQASVEELSIRDIYRLIRGTKANAYSDGILAATQASAVTLARTIVNGVSNNARVETIKANSDVVDGVKFVGTLDGKTCPYCASLDGYIWRGDEMSQARRPPIHPNCRCTLIPYVELKDEQGNVVDVESNRPAANADFDKLAKDAYNANARQRGLARRWDDLAPSTRLKYYYEAQKEFEARTGQKAYDQVPADLTFADYFKNQPDAFKRSWLGAKRFELYQQGKLDEDKIFAPNLSYKASAAELFQISKADQETAQELAELAKEAGREMEVLAKSAITGTRQAQGIKFFEVVTNFFSKNADEFSFEMLKKHTVSYSPEQLEERKRERERLTKSRKKFQDLKNLPISKTIEEAENFAKIGIGVEADYSNAPSVIVANEINEGLRRFFEKYGELETLVKVEFSKYLRDDVAQYDPDLMTLHIKNYTKEQFEDIITKQYKKNHWNARTIQDLIAHEGGHFFDKYLKETDPNYQIRLDFASKLGLILEKKGLTKLSQYAKKDANEFLAEIISGLSADPNHLTYQNLFQIYTKDNLKELINTWKSSNGNS